MKTYDVYIGRVPYEQDEDIPLPRYKARPVVIIDRSVGCIISIAPVTSHEAREWDSGDYQIQDWREAGLNKPSAVRLDKAMDLNYLNIGRKIGRLTSRDIKNIDIILREARGEVSESLYSFPSYKRKLFNLGV